MSFFFKRQILVLRKARNVEMTTQTILVRVFTTLRQNGVNLIKVVGKARCIYIRMGNLPVSRTSLTHEAKALPFLPRQKDMNREAALWGLGIGHRGLRIARRWAENYEGRWSMGRVFGSSWQWGMGGSSKIYFQVRDCRLGQ